MLNKYFLTIFILLFLSACGGGSGTTPIAVAADDTTPSAFIFTDQTGVSKNSEITSTAITVAGINKPTAINILGAGATYSISGGSYRATSGTVTNGQTVRVKHTSSSVSYAETNSILTIGGVTDTFTSSTVGPSYSTQNILCSLSELMYNNDESVLTSSDYSWSCSTQSRILSGNGIPNHEIGTFPNANNPNSISVQNINKNFTLSPTLSSANGASTNSPAYALNSVKFDPGTAGRCDDSGTCSLGGGNPGTWRIEALGHDTFDFGDDMNHAHVQPSGAYHYHGVPEKYLIKLGKGEAMTLIGWAVDGFPVYARYGYSVANDANSAIKIIVPSWRLKSNGDNGRPSTKQQGGSIPLGAFTQDYEYIEGLGDLDRCNGRTGVTPEFPEGIYHYLVTDTFPYASRCLRGSF
jgi:hypothetical protein